jgi:hypothetical protein
MNWINQIEQRKFLIVGGVLLIACSALIVTSLRSPIAFDSFWHLQMGKDWLENGLSPWIDHYSFTFNGQAITNPPVVFQGLLHFLVSQFGIRTGYLVLRFGCFFLTMGAAFLLLRQMKAPAILYAIVIPMIVFLLQVRSIVRPELISYTLSIIALMLYFRAGRTISVRNVLPMVILMWVWSIYHSSIVGYVIFFGFFLDCAVRQFESRAPVDVWVKWLVWGLLLLSVGFLNPGFSHSIIEAITFPSEWKHLIGEYLPPAPVFKSTVGIYALVLIAVLTPVLAWKQHRFGLLVVWVVLAFSAVTMRRMVTPSGIVIVLMAAHLVISSNIPGRLKVANSNFWSNFVGLVLLVSIGVTLYSNVERARAFMMENRSVIGRYPVAMADYMSERKVSGRIFNDFAMGGYLIYRLAHQNQVYIDGRTQILYPPEHMKRYMEIGNTKFPEVLRTELDKYAVDQILWPYTSARNDVVQEMGGFGLDFLDERHVLYTRGESNFPLLGRLMSYPECWRPDMLDELQEERKKMDEILPAYSGLVPFANLVVGYSSTDGGLAFLDASIGSGEWLDEMRRFAGFRFLESGHYDLVVNLLGGVEIQKPKDYLASALAMLQTGEHEIAVQIIEEFSNVQWSRLGTDDVFLYFKLYQLLETHRNLTAVEQQHVEALRLQLVELGRPEPDSEPVLDAGSFCTVSEGWPEEFPMTSQTAGK